MSHSQKINVFMHKLLIENEMDNFSLVEIKDALLVIEEFASTGQDAHKFVYRQVWGLEKKGWLNAEGIGREKDTCKLTYSKDLNLRLVQCL